jgi:hypothetical protein
LDLRDHFEILGGSLYADEGLKKADPHLFNFVDPRDEDRLINKR